jgi:hypothetical protein
VRTKKSETATETPSSRNQVLRVDGDSCIFSEPVYGPDCGAAHKVRVHHQSKNGLTDRHDDYAELAGESGQSDQLMLDGGRAERDRATREYGNLKSQIQKGRPRPITKGRTDSATTNLHCHISLAIWFSPATIRPCSTQDHVSKLVDSSRRQLNQIRYFPCSKVATVLDNTLHS